MNCNQAKSLIEADVDGELELTAHLDLQEHLRACSDCARQADQVRARAQTLRDSLPRHRAPAGLADRIRRELPIPAQPRPKGAFPFWHVIGLAASIAVAGLVGFSYGTARARGNRLMDDAIADHIRSLQANHLTDVASTDQHTVKPWFVGKLDFSPPVVDLAPDGFPLVGGRLEHFEGHAAAALVFFRRHHAINVFVWPAEAAIGSHESVQAGYHTATWTQGGFNFVAVSEIPAAELGDFKARFMDATR